MTDKDIDGRIMSLFNRALTTSSQSDLMEVYGLIFYISRVLRAAHAVKFSDDAAEKAFFDLIEAGATALANEDVSNAKRMSSIMSKAQSGVSLWPTTMFGVILGLQTGALMRLGVGHRESLTRTACPNLKRSL